jgi:MOSC domain-containing protein YiiM
VSEPTKEELQVAEPGSFDTETLTFEGKRGKKARHLTRVELEAAIARLEPAPRDQGRVALLVARGPNGERTLHSEALLTEDAGMPGDRWVSQDKYGPEYQLATMRADFARVIANGQPLELHGDNLFLELDLSSENLPTGSLVRLGQALLRVTPQAHNGCKKWVQRFGLAPMQMNLDPVHRHVHLRGIYLQVVEAGHVRPGDAAVVLERAQGGAPASASARAIGL